MPLPRNPSLAVLVGLAVSQLANLATTIYLHRALAHRAVRLRPPLASGLPRSSSGSPSASSPASGSPCTASTTPSPTSRATRTRPSCSAGSGCSSRTPRCTAARRATPTPFARYAKDLPPDWWDRNVFDHAFVGLGLGIGILIVLLGPVWGLLAALVHTVVYLVVERRRERRRPPLRPPPVRQRRRQPPLAGVHHGRRGLPQQPPRRPDLGPPGHRWWEIDFGWWAISFASVRGDSGWPGSASRTAAVHDHPTEARNARAAAR